MEATSPAPSAAPSSRVRAATPTALALSPITTRAGLLAALLGAVALLGWQFRNESLYEFAHGNMHANSALCFFVVGIAVALLGRGHRGFAFIAGIYAVAMGAGTLAAPTRMDSVVRFYNPGVRPPDHMGDATALCWLVLGAALLVAAAARRRAAAPVVLVAAGSLVAALALLGTFRAWANVPANSGFGSFATMSANTTVGLLVLALAVAALGWRPSLAVLPITVAMFSVILVLWQVFVGLWGATHADELRVERADMAIVMVGLVAAVLLSLAVREARRARAERVRAEEALDELERAGAGRERVQVALEEAMATLKRTNTDLAHFAYVAMHDLTDPLARVDEALTSCRDTPAALASAHGEIQEMRVLVRDLAQYTEVFSDQGQMIRIDLGRLVLAALDRQDELVHQAHAVVDVDRLPAVSVDAIQIGHLFEQLLVNAITFVPDDRRPHVSVTSERERDGWRISVSDNGFGIDPSLRREAFRIFRRLPDAVDRGGTGVGLAVCERIVARHGGRIWVEDGPDGMGSTFSFTIPDTVSYSGPSPE